MQVRAILEAACLVQKEGQAVHPEIIIPLVGTKKELEHQTAVVREVAEKVFAEQGVTVDYLVGTIDRDPARRAHRRPDRRGRRVLQLRHQRPHADDARRQPRRRRQVPAALHERSAEIWPADPFATLDQEGVGQLVEIGIEKGRSTRPQLKVGICGEQGGDPETVKFCHRARMDYVSCSPFRLPVARLAAAQAAIEESGDLQLEK